jgi:predicted Zn finger-like uncharacterized protein
MPIAVTCPGCKASFRVSDQYAGKKGPCPKCKAVITVPAAVPEVVIHGPEEFASAGKDSTGRALSKPIPRSAFRPTRARLAAVAGGVVAVLLAAVATRWLLEGLPTAVQALIHTVGLCAVSPPIVLAGYSFFRDAEELEPYRGRALWLRVGLCSLVYVVLWGAFALGSERLLSGMEYWIWMVVPVPFLLIGGLTALGTLDLAGSNAFFHYCFYLAATLLLRWAAGLDPVWSAALQ